MFFRFFPNRFLPKKHYYLCKKFSNSSENEEYITSTLCKYLSISESKARFLFKKHPCVQKLHESKVKMYTETLPCLGMSKKVLIEEPVLFNILPVTLKYRYKVLKECGIKVKPSHLVSYMSIVKKKTIGQMKKSGDLDEHINVENRLASYMSQWPTSLTTLIYGDVNNYTLYSIRMKIIQRHLELTLNISQEEFQRGLKTYPTVKHRPLEIINETLTILQSELMMPTHKIKSNFYLIHADPDNLRNIIYKFRSIAGIDIKEIIRMHPKLATKNYETLIEIRNILQEYAINNEAQIKCFDIYTLGPKTVRERLEKAKSIPELQMFTDHPRYLKMIHYNTTVMKRLRHLYDNNKKCLSLNILSGSSAHYESFEKAPGDRLGKGKDLVFCIAQSLKNKYSSSSVRHKVKRHPFWINIPLVQVKYVHEKLSEQFSETDIYENCPILLYPWNKIREILFLLDRKENYIKNVSLQHVDSTKLSKMQKLSVVLYLLEKNHYFTGNGIWSEENAKVADTGNALNLNRASSVL